MWEPKDIKYTRCGGTGDQMILPNFVTFSLHWQDSRWNPSLMYFKQVSHTQALGFWRWGLHTQPAVASNSVLTHIFWTTPLLLPPPPVLFFPLLFFFFDTVRLASDLWSPCLSLLSDGVIDAYSHPWFILECFVLGRVPCLSPGWPRTQYVAQAYIEFVTISTSAELPR